MCSRAGQITMWNDSAIQALVRLTLNVYSEPSCTESAAGEAAAGETDHDCRSRRQLGESTIGLPHSIARFELSLLLQVNFFVLTFAQTFWLCCLRRMTTGHDGYFHACAVQLQPAVRSDRGARH